MFIGQDDLLVSFISQLDRAQREQVTELFTRGLENGRNAAVTSLYFIAAVEAWLYPTENNKMLREEAAKLGILE